MTKQQCHELALETAKLCTQDWINTMRAEEGFNCVNNSRVSEVMLEAYSEAYNKAVSLFGE